MRKGAFPLVALAAISIRLMRTQQTRSSVLRPERILIVRLDLLGDIVLTMPAVTALRTAYPSAHIVMLTLPYTSSLARLFPIVDEVVAVDTNRIRTLRGLLSVWTWKEYLRTYQRLRRQRFDLCLSMSGRMASLCSLLVGARRTIGYEHEAYPFTLTESVPGGRYREPMHEVDYCARLAKEAGARVTDLHLAAPESQISLNDLDDWLGRRGVTRAYPMVVIHAGSTNGSAKRWPPSYWADLASRLVRDLGASIVLVGAEGDRPLADEVMRKATTPIFSVVGETSVEELVSLLQRADLIATGDSGPLHLAVALRRPLLCVYGPTDPRIYGPYHPEAPTRMLRTDLPCSPCYTALAIADCPLGDPICMRLVTVRDMHRAALQLLRQHAPSGKLAGDR